MLWRRRDQVDRKGQPYYIRSLHDRETALGAEPWYRRDQVDRYIHSLHNHETALGAEPWYSRVDPCGQPCGPPGNCAPLLTLVPITTVKRRWEPRRGIVGLTLAVNLRSSKAAITLVIIGNEPGALCGTWLIVYYLIPPTEPCSSFSDCYLIGDAGRIVRTWLPRLPGFPGVHRGRPRAS